MSEQRRPTIVSFLGGERIKIFKPKPDEHLRSILDVTRASSPALTAMAFRVMTLPAGSAVPFHRHPVKQKAYVQQGRAPVNVFIEDDKGEVCKFILSTPGQVLGIPAGRWHAVFVPHGMDDVRVLVIMAPIDPQIEWEEGVDGLIAENEKQFSTKHPIPD